MLESWYLLASMCLSQRSLRILEKSLLIAGVRVIGQTFPGKEGSVLAVPLGLSFTTAAFQLHGTSHSIITLLRRLWICRVNRWTSLYDEVGD